MFSKLIHRNVKILFSQVNSVLVIQYFQLWSKIAEKRNADKVQRSISEWSLHLFCSDAARLDGPGIHNVASLSQEVFVLLLFSGKLL